MRDKMIIVSPMKELRIIVASLIEVQAKTKKNKIKNKIVTLFVAFLEKQLSSKITLL